MKLVSVKQDFFDICKFDSELLDNDDRRPYLLVLKLLYKEHNYNFAIPFRSNISKTTPKCQYYALPPRRQTKPGNHHGLHYIKMFPITNEYLESYNICNNTYYEKLNKIINNNFKTIVAEAQNYLCLYFKGERPVFCTNIDEIINVLIIYKK